MFKPEEVIFAPTGRCNLACAHCRVERGSGELSAAEAIVFLDACHQSGIERVGFSGGEPFLAPDFLVALTGAAVDRGMLFDRLMTNGCWWKDGKHLADSLARLRGAGFDGTFGLSYDAWHGQDPETVAAFILEIFRLWERRDCVEILSVRSPDDGDFLKGLADLAARLGGTLEEEAGEPYAIGPEEGATVGSERFLDGARLRVPILRTPRSAGASEDAWKSKRWFADDYCEGPGNVFYVHPDGRVAACCGFANENRQLILGDVGDTPDALLAAAAGNSHLRACYDTGLNAHREALEKTGRRFPGKTADMCFFCDYLCKTEKS